MTALLALVSTKDWVYCGLIAAILAGGTWYHHKLITEGVAEQRTADTVASDKLQAEAAKQTADLQARATIAEQAYDKEQNDDAAYRSAHPLQPVRLCLGTPQTGSRGVPQAGTAVAGNASAGSSSANVPDVPGANSGSGGGTSGPDISSLLSLLAAKADSVSAVLREYQTRED
jgi:hypothetical protein